MKSRRLACAIWFVGLLSVPGSLSAQPATRLPAVIPIFPLPDVVLFPDVSQPLHIFEPRYRAMVADALKGDRIIGMVLLRPGYEADYEGRPPIYPIGSAGVITAAEELPDGRFNIVLRGVVKFRVTGEDQSRPYRLAQVNAIPELPADQEKMVLHRLRQRLETVAAEFLGVELRIPSEIADVEVINALAQHLDLSPIERQELLERQGVLSRSQALIDLLEMKVKTPR